MAMAKFMLSVNCCSMDSVARFLNRKVLILDQLCPTSGPHAAQSKVLCGPVQVFAIVKISYILTTCPYFHNLQFEILMQVV